MMRHRGTVNSSPLDRMLRFGKVKGAWGENIGYGDESARQVVKVELGTGYVWGWRECVGGMFGIFGREGIYRSMSHENLGNFDQTNSKN